MRNPFVIQTARGFGGWLRSPSTKLGALIGFLTWGAYGWAHGTLDNVTLIVTAAAVAVLLPWYARGSNLIEELVNQRFVVVTVGRLARFFVQLAFNLAVFWLLVASGAIGPEIAGVGGVIGAAAVTTLASQGAQYVALFIFQRGFGDLHRNVALGLSATLAVTALATAGVPVIREVFLVAGSALGLGVLMLGILSDLRAVFWRPGGIAVFWGTFNPIHDGHLDLVRRALEERKVERVIMHPTIWPKTYRRWLARGEIRRARVERGYEVLERTSKADVAVDYFPTGDAFLPAATRRDLVKLAIEDAGLADRVEIAWLPELYAKGGFGAVLKEIRHRHPKGPIHVIHGSDFGGMFVRLLMDECGWLYPMPVRRMPGYSATAIRRGKRGLTQPSVQAVLDRLAEEPTRPIEEAQKADKNGGGIGVPIPQVS